MIGRRFGSLIVKKLGTSQNRWVCLCECGTERIVYTSKLMSGKAKSCGCKERGVGALKHGHARRGKWSLTYRSWMAMRDRCFNRNHKDYHNYGGRGIRICQKWDDFEEFLKDVGERPSKQHSIERKNSDANYTKKNCRWATYEEQALNKRRA